MVSRGLSRLLKLAAILLLLLPSVLAAQVVVGDCNIVIINRAAGDVNLTVGESHCSRDGRARAPTARVTYLWLDARSASLLVAGALGPRLREVLGDRPIVLRNDVLSHFEELLRSFGSTIAEQADVARERLDLLVERDASRRRSPSLVSSELTQDLTRTFRDRVRIFDAESPIYFADLELLAAWGQWRAPPAGWRGYYRELYDPGDFASLARQSRFQDDDRERLAGYVTGSFVLWRPVTADDLINHRTNLLRLRDRVLQTGLLPYFSRSLRMPPGLSPEQLRAKYPNIPPDQAALREEMAGIVQVFQNRSIRFMRLASGDAPASDLMRLVGFQQGHGSSGAGNLSVLAQPRRLFMQVAVIESAVASNSPFPVSHVTVGSDGAPGGRIDLPVTTGQLGSGQRLVVPLQFQLRMDFDVGEGELRTSLAPDNAMYRLAQAALRSLPAGPLTGISREAFAKHDPPVFRERIEYGPKVSLRSVRSEGREIPLRQYDPDPAKVFLLAGFEGGSCPVLYVTFADAPDTIVKIGRVLTVAEGADRALSEHIRIDGNVASIILIEDEPETTFLQRVAVKSIMRSGEERDELVSPPARMDYGDVYREALPADDSRAGVVISLRGYYDRWLDGRTGVSASVIGGHPNPTLGDIRH